MPAKRGGKRPKGPSDLEVRFANLWAMHGDRSRRPVRNHRYALDAGRKFEADFAWPDLKVGVELQGSVYRGGRGGGTAKGGHSSATGIQRDIEKGNVANDLDWVIYRYTVKDLRERPVQVVEQVRRALDRRATT